MLEAQQLTVVDLTIQVSVTQMHCELLQTIVFEASFKFFFVAVDEFLPNRFEGAVLCRILVVQHLRISIMS